MTARPTRASIAAVAVWGSAAAVVGLAPSIPLPPAGLAMALALVVAAALALASRRTSVTAVDVTAVGLLVLLSASVSAWRVAPLLDGPLAAAAGAHSFVRAELVTTSDPRVRDGRTSGSRRMDDAWTFEAALLTATVTGETYELDLPVQVITSGDASAGVASLLPGTGLHATGRLLPADPRRGRAATLMADTVEVVRGPPPVQVGAGAVRESLRASVSDRSSDVRGLLPGLVVGDTSAQSPELAQAMRDSGLAHLTAVSGGNAHC